MKTAIKVISLSLVASSLLFAGKNTVPAESDTVPVSDAAWQVALKSGTLGIGVDIARAINDKFAVRLNANGFKYSGYKRKIKGVDTTTDLTLMTVGGLLDYHPFDNSGFRVSAGAYYNGNKVTTTTGKITGSVTINGNTYTGTAVERLDMSLAFNKIAPYAGIGYSNMSESGFGITWDLGIMYHGTPKFSVTPVKASAAVKADVKKYESDINSKLAKYKLYPVAMVGFRYNF